MRRRALEPLGASQYEPTWSNPAGAVLTPLVQDQLWAAERPFVWNGMDVGGKMGVVRLPDGGLWIHSPVDLDEPLRERLAALGPVRHIVSPNFEHVKWARQWKEAYPDATLWGVPTMRGYLEEIPYDQELRADGEPPAEWGGAIDMAYLDYETIPLTDTSFFHEVIFHHRSTRTLFCTDSFWSYPSEGLPFGSRAWKWGMDELFKPFYTGPMVRDEAKLRRVLDRVASWDPVGLLPCHGRYQAEGAASTFVKHMSANL